MSLRSADAGYRRRINVQALFAERADRQAADRTGYARDPPSMACSGCAGADLGVAIGRDEQQVAAPRSDKTCGGSPASRVRPPHIKKQHQRRAIEGTGALSRRAKAARKRLRDSALGTLAEACCRGSARLWQQRLSTAARLHRCASAQEPRSRPPPIRRRHSCRMVSLLLPICCSASDRAKRALYGRSI